MITKDQFFEKLAEATEWYYSCPREEKTTANFLDPCSNPPRVDLVGKIFLLCGDLEGLRKIQSLLRKDMQEGNYKYRSAGDFPSLPKYFEATWGPLGYNLSRLIQYGALSKSIISLLLEEWNSSKKTKALPKTDNCLINDGPSKYKFTANIEITFSFESSEEDSLRYYEFVKGRLKKELEHNTRAYDIQI
jgi:hypothetical protein